MKHNYNSFFLGSANNKELLKTTLKKIDPIIKKIKDGENQYLSAFLNQFSNFDQKNINNLAKYHQKNFKDVIVLGTGGSSKAGRTFVQIAYRTFGRNPKFPKITFLENIDFQDFKDLFKKIVLKKTGVIVISKSGETNETLVQFLIFLTKFKKIFSEKKNKKTFCYNYKKRQ